MNGATIKIILLLFWVIMWCNCRKDPFHHILGWDRKDIPKRRISPTILHRVITQKNYNTKDLSFLQGFKTSSGYYPVRTVTYLPIGTMAEA